MSKFTVVYDACVLYRILDDRKSLVLGWTPDNGQVRNYREILGGCRFRICAFGR